MTAIDRTVVDCVLTLRVAEALPKDVGRGVVRLDPRDLEQLGVAIGEVVQIAAKRATVARVMPAYMKQRGQSLVQMDGIVRANASAGVGEQVSVQRVEAQPARTVTRAPTERSRAGLGATTAAYLVRLLSGIPVAVGDQVRANLLGTRTQTFTVLETAPAGPVVIAPATTIAFTVKDAERKRSTITYEDIGGLHREVRRVREIIELPLRFPELFERVGIRPTRGILLYGAPGTGKTLLAKALARESEANFIAVKGPQLVSMYIGESERAIRDVFRKARQSAPCIVFFDEIDTLAPPRSGADPQAGERIVGQLLTEIDGIESLQGVVVVVRRMYAPVAYQGRFRSSHCPARHMDC